MTIEDIKKMDKEVLTPGDVAPILGCDSNIIRFQAKQDIKQLGFLAAKNRISNKNTKASFHSLVSKRCKK